MHLENAERTTSKSGHNGQYWSSDGDAGTRGRGRSTPAWARRARVRPGTPRRCTVGTEATGPVADARRSDSEASQKAKRVLRRRRGRDQEPRSKCPGVRGACAGGRLSSLAACLGCFRLLAKALYKGPFHVLKTLVRQELLLFERTRRRRDCGEHEADSILHVYIRLLPTSRRVYKCSRYCPGNCDRIGSEIFWSSGTGPVPTSLFRSGSRAPNGAAPGTGGPPPPRAAGTSC